MKAVLGPKQNREAHMSPEDAKRLLEQVRPDSPAACDSRLLAHTVLLEHYAARYGHDDIRALVACAVADLCRRKAHWG